MKETPVKLLYIEDHPVMIRGFRDIFRSSRDDMQMTISAAGVSEAIQTIRAEQFDIIVLDLFLGDTNPVDNICRLRAHYPGKPVLIYSGHTGIGMMKDSFRAGVKAWIVKTAGKQEIKETILRVFLRETILPRELSDFNKAGSDEVKAKNLLHDNFTPDHEQLAIISWLCEGMTTQEIATKRLKVTLSTVEKKLQVIRELAEVKTNCELVAFYLRKSGSNV